MRYLVIFFLFFSLSAFSQSRQVRVTTKKGSVYQGTLKEFKAFEHLIVEVDGKNLLIPYEIMAYIDDVTPSAKAAKRVKPPKPAKVFKPVTVAEPVETKASSFHGFLLAPGNNVYLHCVSDPGHEAYDAAALDVLKRQLHRYNFWTIVDNPADAHFTINYTLHTQGAGKTVLSISSDRSRTQETLGTANRPEDPDDYRKIVYDLFQKHLIPLQSKIAKSAIPKRTRTLFTLD